MPETEISGLIAPVVALVAWTLVALTWMSVVRLPAMSKAGIDAQAAERTADVPALLPARYQWPADNYNHLMEQPTIFYALALALAVAGLDGSFAVGCAWVYVGSRVVHTFVQNLFNKVAVRFAVFLIGTIALIAMVGYAFGALIA